MFFGHCRTSIYDCRARERRRRIEEQKDRADRLRKQVRLADRSRFSKLLSLCLFTRCFGCAIAPFRGGSTQPRCGGPCPSSFRERGSFSESQRRTKGFGGDTRIPWSHRGEVVDQLLFSGTNFQLWEIEFVSFPEGNGDGSKQSTKRWQLPRGVDGRLWAQSDTQRSADSQ